MPLVNTRKMFEMAYKNGYAIGAFNVNNMEITQGIVQAIAEEKAPLILQISRGAREYAKNSYLKAIIDVVVKENPGIPVAINLDHGDTFETCKEFVDDGFTSVMIDGSHLPFEENIAITKKVVEYAHPRGVVVEAELGQLGGIEEDVVGVDDVSKHIADPDQAVEFVERSGCDSLAIACGTSHGAYKFKTAPVLAFDVIEEIGRRLPGFPLVMHGSSSVLKEFKDLINKYGGKMPDAMGVPEEMVTKASKMAMCKVNIDTDLRMALTAKIRQVFAEKPAEFDPRKYLGPGRDAIREMVRHKLHVLGCAGKAQECL
ncbi:MAG: class II fructose-1,6-bisphosphate aldolase [Sedimentisphaerales bacterium]|nr:class II fructose-1,6-bisphosphate aldolase [Sedimentisphaerales bacterium]NLZ06297.1 class II fructose-1,6-bisphosphate aldolase [Phycisphaerae bacterium]HNY79059.1 class II fructose-1,6-bisphosphate aldolase [Sedimentisphaerales bacterium]HOC64449.1 class II fructose-1,6-bisphosphate aldolase [Sedimentisphaerales bacterium]HOH65115.1 class II fructose-1,6-bisphosphate aldolase [Sedimentisphaerales bacterium]